MSPLFRVIDARAEEEHLGLRIVTMDGAHDGFSSRSDSLMERIVRSPYLKVKRRRRGCAAAGQRVVDARCPAAAGWVSPRD